MVKLFLLDLLKANTHTAHKNSLNSHTTLSETRTTLLPQKAPAPSLPRVGTGEEAANCSLSVRFTAACHNYIHQPTTPYCSTLELYQHHMPPPRFRYPRYLLLRRFTLAEGALLLLDTGAFLVDAFT